VPGVWKVAQRTLLARAIGNEATTLRERRALRTTLAVERQQEVEDLCALLLEHGSPAAERSVLNLGLARALAFGSLGPAHLWHDLGLCDRPQLRILIGTFFPAMIERNVGDMRWKRFFYRQLCEVGGDYVCRAPTCGECSSFTECFPSSQRG
jgi:nitrogen fixation protein NifQ